MLKSIISWVIRKVPRKYLQIISPVVMKFFALINKGDTVECTVCNARYTHFLPYGRISPRANALCPSCLSLERHRLMQLFLREKTDFYTAKLKVLHIAPEHCFISRFEQLPNLDYITADIESPLAKVKMDMHDIPFADDTFDVAFCNHVMEHVRDDIRCMSEIRRVLRPGGWAIIQSPLLSETGLTHEDPAITDPAERERVYGQDDHVRSYGADYGRILERAGFQVREDDYVMQMDAAKVARYALPADEIVYYCVK